MSNIDVRDNCYYSKEHEWLRLIDDSTAIVGITDYAQSSLGDIVFVELPPVGRIVRQGEAVSVVESVKSASDVYCPVTGEILEVNSILEQTPEIVNNSPYDEGWFFKVRLSNDSELKNLMDSKEYKAYLQSL